MLTQDQKDAIRKTVTDTKNQMVALAIAAVIAVLSIIAAGVNDAPPVAPEVPAPVPADIGGVDGQGALPGGETEPLGLPTDLDQLTDEERASIVAEPDAGTDKGVTLLEPTEPGVGGITIVTSPAWDGGKTLNAGWAYSSGALHKAWDVGTAIGNPLYAAFNGKVVGASDGVKNNKWGHNPGSGSPSNWLLLCRVQPKGTPFAGKTVVLYYQHLSPGLKVKRGQNVKLGQRVATAGNSGFSTGPHTHFAATVSPYGCSNYTQSRAAWVRYLYLNDSSRTVFAPNKAWRRAAGKTITLSKIQPGAKPVVKLSNLKIRKRNSNVKRLQIGLRSRGAAYRKLNPSGATGGYYSETVRMTAKWQRAQGWRGRDADGRIGCTGLKRLNKANGSKWTVKC